MREDAFTRLQTVMSEAGELENLAPYSEIVNNNFAKEAIK